MTCLTTTLKNIYYKMRNDNDSDSCSDTVVKVVKEICTAHLIIINIRGQIENRPLENSCYAGRKWLPAGCKCIYRPCS